MASDIKPVEITPNSTPSDVVATPEGDNEFLPDEALLPVPAAAEETPRGSAPDDYKAEK